MAKSYTYSYCTRSRMMALGIILAVLLCGFCACFVILSREAILPWIVLFWCVFGTGCIMRDFIHPKTWQLLIQNGILEWESPRQPISTGSISVSEIETVLTSDGEIPVCVLVLRTGERTKLPANCIGNVRELEAALIDTNPHITIAPLYGNA